MNLRQLISDSLLVKLEVVKILVTRIIVMTKDNAYKIRFFYLQLN